MMTMNSQSSACVTGELSSLGDTLWCLIPTSSLTDVSTRPSQALHRRLLKGRTEISVIGTDMYT